MKSWRKIAAVIVSLGMCGVVGCFGKKLRSEAMIAEGWPKRLIFDRAFLLYLKEKQAKYPYLAIWVAHPEILMKK